MGVCMGKTRRDELEYIIKRVPMRAQKQQEKRQRKEGKNQNPKCTKLGVTYETQHDYH